MVLDELGDYGGVAHVEVIRSNGNRGRAIMSTAVMREDPRVPFAEFWEKEYEIAFAIELASRGGYVLSPRK